MTAQDFGDGIIRTADRRMDVRYVGPVNGCYTLSEQRLPGGGGDIEVYACRTQSISSQAAAVQAPVASDPGGWLTARFDGLGIVRGTIERLTSDGFVFEIVASDANRRKLAAKIDWLKKNAGRQRQDKRDFKRMQPRDARSTLGLADGGVARCFVIDYSRSGAAVSARITPDIGSPIVLGTLRCHVVRRLDVGFAVQFDAVQDAENLEPLITGFEPNEGIAPAIWPEHQ
jgi:hypothetical protein